MQEYHLYGNVRVPCGPERNRRDNPKNYFTITWDGLSDTQAIATAEDAMDRRRMKLLPEQIISACLWKGRRLVKYFAAEKAATVKG